MDEKEENVQRIVLKFKSRSAKAEDLKGQKPVELRITRAGLDNLLGDAKANTESGIEAPPMRVHAEGKVKVPGAGLISAWTGFFKTLAGCGDRCYKGIAAWTKRTMPSAVAPAA